MSDEPARLSPEDFDEFAEVVKGQVRSVGEDFTEPDDDWFPVMHAMSGTGELYILGMEITPETKDLLASFFLPLFITATGAKLLAHVISAWMAPMDPDKPDDKTPPSEREDRIEVVMVNVIASHQIKSYHAKIERYDDGPPTLGEWESIGDGSMGGRFIEPLQAALRDSSGTPNTDLLAQIIRPIDQERG